MKFLSKKVIKGKPYYYIQYKKYSKYLGSSYPDKSDMMSFYYFFKDVADQEYMLLPNSVKEDFRYGNLKLLERLHHDYICHENELFLNIRNAFESKFIILFTYHSNRQEGSKTTRKQIEEFAASGIRKPKTVTDRELMNSFDAFKYATSPDMKWNAKHIKKIHELLLHDIAPLISGKWKNENNVAPGEQLTTDYSKVNDRMKDLLKWLHLRFKMKDMYSPGLAIKFYCRFEAIHPFLDGNGRVGRILLNAILKKFKYPYVIFFSDNVNEHNSSIEMALNGRWNKINKHFLKQVAKTDKALV